MTLPLIDHRVWGADDLRKDGGRLDVTFADEICEVVETQTTYMTCRGLSGKLFGFSIWGTH